MKRRTMLAVVLAMVAVLGVAVTAYAKVGDQSITKSGDTYIQDTVTAEWKEGEVTVQTIDRRFIPAKIYENGGKVTSDDVLRTASKSSKDDLESYGRPYKWVTTYTETSHNGKEMWAKVSVILDDQSATYNGYGCEFDQWVGLDSKGKPVVRYYLAGQEFTAQSIKNMMRDWSGKK